MDGDRSTLQRKVGKGVAKSSVANNCLKEWKLYTNSICYRSLRSSDTGWCSRNSLLRLVGVLQF